MTTEVPVVMSAHCYECAFLLVRVLWERGEEAIMDVVDCPNLAQKMAEGTLRKAARSALTCSSPEAAVKMTTVCVLTSARYYECALL
jgi:hypothetical protein